MRHVVPIREKHGGTLGDGSSVRVWLRLLSCTMAVEKEVQRRFAEQGMSLARFDVLAALDRHGEMRMGALSQALLVTNGNATQLVDRLERSGLVRRRRLPSDRRTAMVSLTEEGRDRFRVLARVHQDWIDQLLGALDFTQRERLYVALGALKLSIARGSRRKAG